MGEKAPALISPEDYLESEKTAATKHEYLGGIIHAMAGAGTRHSHIVAASLGLLFNQLRGKSCFPITPDTKIRITYQDHQRFYYPDAGVVCESNATDEHFQDRPVLLIEVLSPSTRRTDLLEKKDAYLTIPSLHAYCLINPDEPEVTLYQRLSGRFVTKVYNELGDTISLPDIGLTLPLAELYERIDFSAKEED